MLREVVLTDDRRFQMEYLKKIYSWFISKNVAIGLIPKDQMSAENDLLNPQ